jgi:hypothetical protein
MVSVSIENNIKEVSRKLTDIQKKQVPFAASLALNKVAYQANMAIRKQAKYQLHNPTNWTISGFLYDKSNKKNLNVLMYAAGAPSGKRGRLADRNKYMIFQVHGGTRFPDGRAIIVPTKHTRLNKHGNIPRALLKQFVENKTKYFAGKPRGRSNETNAGVYERVGRGGRKSIKKVASFVSTARYSDKRLDYYGVINKVVTRRFKGIFAESLDLAIKYSQKL